MNCCRNIGNEAGGGKAKDIRTRIKPACHRGGQRIGRQAYSIFDIHSVPFGTGK